MSFPASLRRWIAAVLFAGSALSALAADHSLIDAIKNQDHKRIASLIATGAQIDVALPDGSTPLAWASYQDDTETADLLLSSGAEVKTSDDYGETPLTLACANGNAHLVEEFLKRGADANSARAYGETALMIAASSGNPGLLSLLIEHGANVNATEKAKGQNALMWAAAAGKVGAVDVLVKAGANPNSVSESGFTPLIFATEKGDALSAERLLAAGADANYLLPGKANALLLAVTMKRFRVSDVLIEHGANLAVRDRAGNTAFHIAASFGSLSTVKLLIAKGADVNAKTNATDARRGGGNFRRPVGEQTPLLLAARANHVEIMRALSHAGADPKSVAQDGSTLLMAAASSGRPEAVEYAYQLDPDLKALTNSKTAVMHAAVVGTSSVSTQEEICKVIQFLADRGADLDPADANGGTPVSIAKTVPMEKAVELLTRLIAAAGSAPRTAASVNPARLP